MAESTINDFELGNLCFGNSRGCYNFPNRELVDCKEWQELMQLLQVEDYHCSIGDYYFDYEENCNKKRSNGLIPTNFGGYICKDKNGEVIFELFPYWWGDCTCGAEDFNNDLEENLLETIFSIEERTIFEYFDEWCNDDCPACDWLEENERKTTEELDLLCTCGNRAKNKQMKQAKELIEDKVKNFYEKYKQESKVHDDNCLLIKHNFVYRPNTEQEIWIDWYKYPFRDSHTNIELNDEMFKKMIEDCIQHLKAIL